MKDGLDLIYAEVRTFQAKLSLYSGEFCLYEKYEQYEDGRNKQDTILSPETETKTKSVLAGQDLTMYLGQL